MYYYYYRPTPQPVFPMPMPQHGSGAHHQGHGQPFHPSHPSHGPHFNPLHPVFPPALHGVNPLAALLGGLSTSTFGNLLTAPSAIPSNVLSGLPSPPPQAIQRYQFLAGNPTEMQSLAQQAQLQSSGPNPIGGGLPGFPQLPSLTGGREEEDETRFPWLLPFCVFRWAVIITISGLNLSTHLAIVLNTNALNTTVLQVLPFTALGTIPTSSIVYVECF